jgi:DUF971 family protein
MDMGEFQHTMAGELQPVRAANDGHDTGIYTLDLLRGPGK